MISSKLTQVYCRQFVLRDRVSETQSPALSEANLAGSHYSIDCGRIGPCFSRQYRWLALVSHYFTLRLVHITAGIMVRQDCPHLPRELYNQMCAFDYLEIRLVAGKNNITGKNKIALCMVRV